MKRHRYPHLVETTGYLSLDDYRNLKNQYILYSIFPKLLLLLNHYKIVTIQLQNQSSKPKGGLRYVL